MKSSGRELLLMVGDAGALSLVFLGVPAEQQHPRDDDGHGIGDADVMSLATASSCITSAITVPEESKKRIDSASSSSCTSSSSSAQQAAIQHYDTLVRTKVNQRHHYQPHDDHRHDQHDHDVRTRGAHLRSFTYAASMDG